MSPVTLWQKISAGIFVLVSIATWIFFSINLSGAQYGKTYHTFLSQSVKGLAPGSQVCYNGIEVGRVTRISNDFQKNQVRVDFVITDEDIKIFQDPPTEQELMGTRALLIGSLVTGIQYINLIGGHEKYPELEINKEVPSGVSDSAAIFKNAADITEDIKGFTDAENIKNTRELLKNLNQMSQNWKEEFEPGKFSRQIQKILDNLDQITGEENQRLVTESLENVKDLTDPEKLQIQKFIDSMEKEVQKVTQKAEEVLASSQSIMQKVENLIDKAESEEDISGIVAQVHDILKENRAAVTDILANIEKVSAKANHNVDAFAKESYKVLRGLSYFLNKELQRTNQEVQVVLGEISSVLRIIKAKPNALLWGSNVRGK